MLLSCLGSSRITVMAKDVTASLISQRVIDVCGDKRDVIITISLGTEIKQSDSLFGFDFEARFDSTKFRFHTLLRSNTLAEFLEIAELNPFNSKGLITGFAGNINFYKPPAFSIDGRKDLIAFAGTYIGPLCPDESIIEFDFIEFTEEFKLDVVNYEDATVITEVSDKPDRLLAVTLEPELVFFGKNEHEKEVKVKVSGPVESKLEYFKLEISGFTEDVMLTSVTEKDGFSNVTWQYNTNGDKKAVFDVEISGNYIDNGFFSFNVLRQTKDTFDIELRAELLEVNKCACISRYSDDVTVLRGMKDSLVNSVKENLYSPELSYNPETGVIIIPRNFQKIEVYDVHGRLIYRQNGNNNGIIRTAGFPKGIYIVMIYESTSEVNRIILNNSI